VPQEANRSYQDVLRNRHVAGLLLGDLLANAGTGMIIVAMPVQTLSIHGSVPKAIAIGLVEAAPFVLSTMLALAIGLGRIRVPPRSLLIADCVLRSLTFATLGHPGHHRPAYIADPDSRSALRCHFPARRIEQPAPAGHVHGRRHGTVRRQRAARVECHLRALHRRAGPGRCHRRIHQRRRRTAFRLVRCLDLAGRRADVRSPNLQRC
jgi:hypothetical protein